MKQPDKITSYFKLEWKVLLIITITGIIYNLGLLAGPLFEGKLVQCLFDIYENKSTFIDMLYLVIAYISIIAIVQVSRYLKRFYVRRFGNHVNRNMKEILYANLVHYTKKELENQEVGSMMTKAISDVDMCSEGMRKFTTEIFDTGVVLIGYVGLLLSYDVKLALISLVFPPIAYIIAERLKVVVQKYGALGQESRSRLNGATLDRVSNALTYRVFGCEQQRNENYETYLEDYETSMIKANVLVAAMPPIYQMISMTSFLFILYFGCRNVLGTGWVSWNIAAFTTFISCYTKLAVKSSVAAKLFNAIQKAEVSWKRIKPMMKSVEIKTNEITIQPSTLEVYDLGFAYQQQHFVYQHLSFLSKPNEWIGITGPVACGKSTLGKTFLCEHPYVGSITYLGKELSTYTSEEIASTIGYLGHDVELLSDTIENNIKLGRDVDVNQLLKLVCMDQEVEKMPQGIHTVIGNGGMRLSGGQQARIALARTLARTRPIYILDDPFSALDQQTEIQIFYNLKSYLKDSIVILISHRLYLFSECNQVILMNEGQTIVSTHEKLMKNSEVYKELYELQKGEQHA